MTDEQQTPARVLHCWAGRYEVESEGLEWGSAAWAELWIATHEDNGGATCMLEAGHEGPHEWTPDGEITVEFK